MGGCRGVRVFEVTSLLEQRLTWRRYPMHRIESSIGFDLQNSADTQLQIPVALNKARESSGMATMRRGCKAGEARHPIGEFRMFAGIPSPFWHSQLSSLRSNSIVTLASPGTPSK